MSSSEKAIKVGVIGLGVGEKHVRAYQAMAGVEVSSVCDIDPAKLQEVGGRLGIRGRHTDFRTITDDPEIDVVSICSYDDTHAEQAIAAFAGGKHVMVEKPLCLKRQDAAAILRAQQDSGRLLTSNLILRRSPRFEELKKRIADGDLGTIHYAEGDYIHQILWKLTDGWRGRMDFYNVMYGGGIHLIDLMRWLIGEEITEVCGLGANMLVRDSAYRYDDSIVALLRFASGAVGKTYTSLGPQHPKFHALKLFGTKATFVNQLGNADWYPDDEPSHHQAIVTPYARMDKGDLLPDFIAAVRAGREPEVTARDVFRVMDVCFAIRDSIEQRRTVTVEYLI